ncbi:c-type cytochrome biogenesis protein CcmI [Phreatobacter sp.]|uniref:c-type cytochrome biogenesis protein CcmI n=1 Tax=Phreatobacter sp. TaxID=1966341 RepID=UPI003F7134B3
MTVWIVFAAMTAAAIVLVLAPLARAGSRVAATSGSGAQVYRDQLAEIDRDLAAGLIGKSEASAARIEVSRRLIAADAQEGRAAGSDGTRRRRIVAVAAFVVLPLVAAVGYGLGGQPGVPAQPLAQRLQGVPDRNDYASLVARIEAHLSTRPEDGRGWEVIAPVYLLMGRIPDAVRARSNALRLLGSTADRETDLAEAQIVQAQGVVTVEAKAGIARALALEPDHPKAGYFLGLAAEQDGKPEEARRIWARLVSVAPQGAPWLDLLRREIARLDGSSPEASQTPPTAPPATGPQAAAPAAPPPQVTSGAIRGMVDGLAARLAADGSDFEGWLRLVRSYAVLGEGARAREAAAKAREHFGAETDKMTRLDALMRELGIGG